ncbi:MAG TPA: hypothetical protein VK435_10420 [Thermodesulfovibrionales bacterium]|nr:hypothetical protein [Thermodesulfovibrionales bacterium]
MTDEEKVLTILREKVLKADISQSVEIYLARRAAGENSVALWTGTMTPPSDFKSDGQVWVAYIDLMPGANFEHPVQFVFISPKTGSVHTVDASTPPNDLAENFHRVKV